MIDINLCAKAFCSFHGISKNKLYYVQKSLKPMGCAPKDKRGKHSKEHRHLNRVTADWLRTILKVKKVARVIPDLKNQRKLI